jgi:hypothetical protein
LQDGILDEERKADLEFPSKQRMGEEEVVVWENEKKEREGMK